LSLAAGHVSLALDFGAAVNSIEPMSTRFKSVLALRDFRYLVGSTSIDALGARLSHMLLIALVAASHPGQVLAYSQGSLIVGLPPILFAPFAGVLIDRWDRRRTLLITHFVQTGLLLSAPVFFLLTRSLTPAWVVLFLFFTADIFKNSSAPAILPGIVRPDDVLTANSLWFTFARAATVIGMVAGGFLVKLVGWNWGFSINGVTHLAAGLLVFGIAANRAFHPAPAQPELATALVRSSRRFVRELREVVVLVGRNRYVTFVMFTIIASLSITGIAYSLLAFIIQQTLKLGTSGVGIYSGILAGGMVAGSVLIGVIGDRWSKTKVIVLGCAAIGVLFMAGPWMMNVWYMAIVALVAGVAYSWIGIAQTAILQTRVALDIQGRIFATREFFANVTFLATTFIVGLTSLVARIQVVLVIVGGGLLIFSAIGYLIIRGLNDDEPEGDLADTH
jgi:MFS transporter, DHA3 family, macrolide efflux protein